MKLNAALAKTLLMAASVGVVVPMMAQTPVVTKAPAPAVEIDDGGGVVETPAAQTVTPTPAPAPVVKSHELKGKPKAPVKAPTTSAVGVKPAPATGAVTVKVKPTEAPKAEVEVVIPGQVLERRGGGFISVTLAGGNFRLSFYDDKKKPVAVDVARGIARWDPVNKAGEARNVLNPTGDGMALQGNLRVDPPFVFKVYLTLIGTEGTASEAYVFDFRG